MQISSPYTNKYSLMDIKLLSSLIKHSQNEFILPSGTTLYHATMEKFDYQKPRGGGFDEIFWTTYSEKIAKTYIPMSGLVQWVTTGSIIKPTTDLLIQNLQKVLGIEYDASRFKVDQSGQVVSWYGAKIFNDPKLMNNEELKCSIVNEKMKSILGHEQDGSGCYCRWKIRYDRNYMPQKADFREKGTLLTITTTKDMKIYDMTYGGQLEGDLTNVDYNKIKDFRKAEQNGYDGVQINDFAQSNNLGNVNHVSVGLFKHSLNNIKIETSEVFHEDLD